MKYLLTLAFALCIPAANWLVSHWGTSCVLNGPCLVPVAPGLYAPSGVLMVGLALVLRDALQMTAGPRWTLGAIIAGTVLSWLVASPALALASAAAFLLSELADFAVYTPLARRRLFVAVIASGLVGSVVDSAAFLLLAFGSLDFMAGQVVGKAWATILALPVIWAVRKRVTALSFSD